VKLGEQAVQVTRFLASRSSLNTTGPRHEHDLPEVAVK